VPHIWRLVKTKYAAAAFDGEGARLYGGRWSSPGVRVAYGSSGIPLAILEVLVHLRASQFLRSYSLVSADVPDDLVAVLPESGLPPNWKQYPAPSDTTSIGDGWINRATSAVLSVPSVIVESERNYLLNPQHPDFAHVSIAAPTPFTFDPRLLG
jgi:RES domain-containing protein